MLNLPPGLLAWPFTESVQPLCQGFRFWVSGQGSWSGLLGRQWRQWPPHFYWAINVCDLETLSREVLGEITVEIMSLLGMASELYLGILVLYFKCPSVDCVYLYG